MQVNTTTTINYTGNAELDLVINDLNLAFAAKDKSAMLTVLQTIATATIAGGAIADWITEPSVFAQMKAAFVSEFAIDNRMMQLKTRVPHRHRRAIIFSKMFINAMQRVNEQ